MPSVFWASFVHHCNFAELSEEQGEKSYLKRPVVNMPQLLESKFQAANAPGVKVS